PSFGGELYGPFNSIRFLQVLIITEHSSWSIDCNHKHKELHVCVCTRTRSHIHTHADTHTAALGLADHTVSPKTHTVQTFFLKF
uniref:Uncharacterized protein n=1 Tax=Anabas testudineus TaxID=64144 RepID=A0A7N6A9F5_ANATE